MLIRVIDFETLGWTAEDGVCEVGWCDVYEDGCGEPNAMLVDPGKPIPPKVTGVHGTTDAMVAGCPPTSAGFMRLTEGGPTAFCAHNCEFEQRFFKGGDTPWICTYKVALRVIENAPSYKNGELITHLGITVDPAWSFPLHRAGPDAYLTARLLSKLMEFASVDDMIRWSREPKQVRHMPFGRHKGKPWSEVPTRDLRWIVHEAERMGDDIKEAARRELLARENR